MANHGNAANAAMYGGVNAPVLPPAGQYSDMQLLMRDMDTLSTFLQRNREEWQQIQDGLSRVERMHGRLARDSLHNGDVVAQAPSDIPYDPENQATIISLQNSLAAADERIVALEQTYRDQQKLQAMYEDSLAEATERIRTYIFAQQTYINDLHKNYAALLEAARWETIQAQVTHQAWQDGLKRVSDRVRDAIKSREEEGRPFRGRIAALKSENRILRQMVGWEPPVDSDDEEEEGEGGGGGGGAGGAGEEPVRDRTRREGLLDREEARRQ